MTWKKISGTDLTNSAVGVSQITENGGVYLWRKCLPLRPGVVTDPEAFLDWIRKGVSTPIMSAQNIKISRNTNTGKVAVRDDFLRFSNAIIGGGTLTESKENDLRQEIMVNADDLYDIFQDAAMHYGPILYVGESKNLRIRIKTHISNNSDLRRKLTELGLDLESTVLYYFEMEDKPAKERQMIEQVFTHLFVAPLTHRAG